MATAAEVQQAVIDTYVEQQKAKGYWDVDEDEDPTYFDTLLIESDFLYDLEKNALETTLGTVEMVENVGGPGEGETRYFVVSLTNSSDGEVNNYFRVDGYYASWDGDSWEGAEFYEVEAVPVQKIEYRRKK